jgi:protease I
MRVLMISADGFEDTELLVPLYRLREARVPVDLASPKQGTITGKHGHEVATDRSVDEVDAEAYDMLVLPGGKAPTTLRKDARVRQIARRFFEREKPVAAICHGPQVLASAGLLKGRIATAYKSVQPELMEAGAEATDAELVVDGNLITSREPSDLPAFAREIMHRLGAQPA